MSRYRIVVADQAEAVFYDLASLEKRPREVARISDPVAHLHERDMVSDRPGRSHTRVGSARFAIEREHEPRRQEAARFAKRIARRLDEARRKGEFEDLIVVAGPPFLGVMRAELSRLTRARVVHEVPKDLVHGTAESLRKYLPESDQGLRPA
jgi:protein required for attachment to host cells